MQSKHSHPQASRYPLFRFHQVREALQLVAGYRKIAALLNNQADQLPPFLLRLVLAYEFWEAGLMKIESKNWFSQLDFPFPFNLFSDDSLWTLATWFEITGAIALLLGLGTRFFAAALMMLLLPRETRRSTGAELRGGLLVGGSFGLGIWLQMAGLSTVSPPVSAFLTALTVVLVPIGQLLFLHRRL